MISPELAFAVTQNPGERRRLRLAVIESCREQVAAVAREMLPAEQHASPSFSAPMAMTRLAEAEQVGAMGVLVALDRFDPARDGEGEDFFAFARPWVVHELTTWLDEHASDPFSGSDVRTLLADFASTLTVREAALFYAEHPAAVRSVHYTRLVARARAHVAAARPRRTVSGVMPRFAGGAT